MITIKTNVSPPMLGGSGGFSPTSICPVGNPIEFVFEADAVFANAVPAQGSLVFSPTSLTTDGDSFTLNGRTFYARNSPGLRDFQAGVISNTVCERIYNILSNDPVLSVLYDFEIGLADPPFVIFAFIKIVAKANGSTYNITQAFNVADPLSIGGTAFPAANSNVGQGLTDFGVYIKLTVDTAQYAKTNLGGAPISIGNTQYVTVNQLFTAKLNRENRMAIDLSGALAPFVKTNAPALWAGGVTAALGLLQAPQNFKLASEMLVRYFIEYGVEYIPTGETTPTRELVGYVGRDIKITDPQRYAANSALPLHMNKSRVSIRYRDWWERIITAGKLDFEPRKILHNYPFWKLSHIDSVELIYFYRLSRAGRDNLCVKWTYEYESGAQGVHYGVLSNIALSVGTAYYVEVGWRQLRQSLPTIEANELLARFTAEIVEYQTTPATGTTITVPQGFELLNEKRCDVWDSPQLVWLNPLGGWDSWVFTGAYDRTAKVEVNKYSSAPKFIDTVTGLEYENSLDSRTRPDEIADSKSYGAISRASFKLRSTGLDEDHLRWLQESLIPTTQCYCIAWQEADNAGNPEGRYARRIELRTRELEIKRFQNYYSIEIEIENSLRTQTLPN